MAISTDGQNVYMNITDLPEIDEISTGDLLIVETPEGTSVLDFRNFLISTDNVTFGDVVQQNTTDIATLSAQAANRQLVVGYYISTSAAGPTFTTGAALPVNFIQSNTIDGNFQNASSTLCGITSGSSAINLNVGTYYVTGNVSIGGGSAVLDLYDSTNSKVLLTSDYNTHPSINGTFSVIGRTDLQLRGFSSGSRTVGNSLDFNLTNLVRVPVQLTFTKISDTVLNYTRPDTRS